MVEQDAMPYFLASRMPGQRLAQPAFTGSDLLPRSTERVLWQGHAAVAEFALSDGALTPPRWSLPDTTEVTITDRRVAYSHVPGAWPAHGDPAGGVTSGEARWVWPQHLRVQPGARTADSISEIHLVCGPVDGTWPTVVLAGGDVASVREADKVANLLRRAIVQFRLDNAGGLGLSTPQSRMLSRLLITPEFGNYPGGPGQTVPLPGAYPLIRADEPAPFGEPARVVQATAPHEGEALDRAPRASTVAARVAELVRTSAMASGWSVPAPQWSAPVSGPRQVPVLTPDRAKQLSAARAANSGQHRGVAGRSGSGPDTAFDPALRPRRG